MTNSLEFDVLPKPLNKATAQSILDDLLEEDPNEEELEKVIEENCNKTTSDKVTT